MTESSPAIDPRSPVPKYHQLQEILLDLVETELAVDAPIPSERELADRFNLSRMTVRQAIDGLRPVARICTVAEIIAELPSN